MYALVKLFWDICLFRRGPQDTPPLPNLLALLVILNLVFAFILLQIPNSKGLAPESGQIIRFLLLHTIVIFALVYVILWASRFRSRFLQTMIAMLGADLVVSLAQLPLHILASYITDQVSLAMVVFIGFMFTIGWGLAIHTHIFRHALSCSIFRGGAFAILVFIASMYVQLQVLRVPA